MNNYPNSEYTDECNQLINELQNKIEKKEFEVAKQYYTIYDYRAAINSMDNFIAEFVGSKFREKHCITSSFPLTKSQSTALNPKTSKVKTTLKPSTTTSLGITQKHCSKKTSQKKWRLWKRNQYLCKLK